MTVRWNYEHRERDERTVGAARGRTARFAAGIATAIVVATVGVISALSAGAVSVGRPGSTGLSGEVVALFVVLTVVGAALVVAGIVPLKRRRDH